MAKLSREFPCALCGQYEDTRYHNPAVEGSHEFKRKITLTPTQRRVLYLLVQGNTNAQIGQAMHLAEKTIKAHVTSILKATKCKSRGQVIVGHYQNTLPSGVIGEQRAG